MKSSSKPPLHIFDGESTYISHIEYPVGNPEAIFETLVALGAKVIEHNPSKSVYAVAFQDGPVFLPVALVFGDKSEKTTLVFSCRDFKTYKTFIRHIESFNSQEGAPSVDTIKQNQSRPKNRSTFRYFYHFWLGGKGTGMKIKFMYQWKAGAKVEQASSQTVQLILSMDDKALKKINTGNGNGAH